MSLLNDMKDILNLAHAQGWVRTLRQGRSQAPDEPGLVSQLVSGSVGQALRSAMKASPPAGSTFATMSGTFIHQSPKVLLQGGAEVELGDLLLVVVNEATGRGRAGLFQAKKNSQPSSGRLTGNEQAQFGLYQAWPDFILKAPLFPPQHQHAVWKVGADPENGLYMAAYDGYAYDEDPLRALPTGDPSALRRWAPVAGPGRAGLVSFGQSLGVDMDEPTWRVGQIDHLHTSQSGVPCPTELAEYMHALLQETVGREFVIAGHRRNASYTSWTCWDDLINGLLEMGAHPAYRYSHIRTGVGSRQGVRHQALLLLSGLPARHLLAFDSYWRDFDGNPDLLDYHRCLLWHAHPGQSWPHTPEGLFLRTIADNCDSIEYVSGHAGYDNEFPAGEGAMDGERGMALVVQHKYAD